MIRILLIAVSLACLCVISLAQETVSQKDLMEHLLREESANGGSPQYPPLARQARIQGTVVLDVFVDEEGKVQDVHLVSGHPMLASSAIASAKSWRFRPFASDEKSIAVEGRVSIAFKLEESLEQLAQRFDENFLFEMNRAHACLDVHEHPDYEQAGEHARKALDLAQSVHRLWEEAQVRILLAQIHEGEQKDALKEFDQAMGLIKLARSVKLVSASDPKLAEAYFQGGRFYFKSKRYDSSESAFAEALQAWRLRPPLTPEAKAQRATAASMAAFSSIQMNHAPAAAAYCELFRRERHALQGLELDEAQERCRQVH